MSVSSQYYSMGDIYGKLVTVDAGLVHAAIANASEKIDQAMRHHWTIENGIFHVRDGNYGEGFNHARRVGSRSLISVIWPSRSFEELVTLL